MIAPATSVLDRIDCDEVAEIFAELTVEAAVAVMCVYAGQHNAREKPDKSFVCDADERAEAIILRGLSEHLPRIPVVARAARSLVAVALSSLSTLSMGLASSSTATTNSRSTSHSSSTASLVPARSMPRPWGACGWPVLMLTRFSSSPARRSRRAPNVIGFTCATIPDTA